MRGHANEHVGDLRSERDAARSRRAAGPARDPDRRARRGEHDGHGHGAGRAARPRSSRCSRRRCGAGWSAPGASRWRCDLCATLPALSGRARTRCSRCATRGFRLAVLTQSAVEPSETALANAGIREHFEHVLSAPELRRLQARGPGLHAPRWRSVGATDAWFVAGHWWDVAGATFAGLKTAWISRTDLAYPVAMPEPDVAGADVERGRCGDPPTGPDPGEAARSARAAAATSSSTSRGASCGGGRPRTGCRRSRA